MNVLIIKHQDFSVERIQETFISNGYNVFICSTKSEVADFVELRCPSLFLLPADEVGFSISRFIRSSRVIDYNLSSTPILFLGENDVISQRIESISNGGSDFVDRTNLAKIIKISRNLLEPDLLWKGAKVVVVEDDKTSARIISSYVENMGSVVKWFMSGEECLKYLEEESADLLLVDYIMPAMNGAELTKKIRNELGLKELPIIFTSSTLDKEEILEFYRSGGNDYISKPFLKEELYTKMKLQLESSQNTRALNVYIEELKNLSNVKDQFLAVCSHDLKTPLNSIIGYTDVLKSDTHLDEEGVEILDIINNASKDLLSLVDDILTCSEVHLSGEVAMKNLKVTKVVEYILKQVKGISKKQLEYDLKIDVKEPIILGNEPMLRRVFSNIYSNALKFTPSGGKIVTRVWEEGDYIKCSITDSGIGIPEKHMEKVFSKMSGLGRLGLEGQKSTGLGLSIVKDIIEKHRGRVEVESQEKIGTTFTLTFLKGR
ncbi:response regulator [Halobacteriovorax sp.]|uniref:response regulator n=1 Tax=Halobacteriovorax sp. TaxID=2020862 RepID=UPI0035671C47